MGMIILINPPSGEKYYTGAPGDFAPEMQKRNQKPSKIKNGPLKIAIDCNIKIKSVHSVQCCRFSQWDVKSNPRK